MLNLTTNERSTLLSLTPVLCAFAGNAAFAADLDVTQFGAIAGDGIDDAVAINRAIAASATGDAIVFGKGEFEIASQIYPKSGTTLRGAGMDGTTIRYIGGRISHMVRLSHRSDVELTGFTLDGDSNPYALSGVLGNAGARHHIHGIRVRNLVATGFFGPHGVYFDNNVVDATVEDCEFLNIGKDAPFGSGIRFNNGSLRGVIQRNVIVGTGRGGIHCSASPGAVIRGNRVDEIGQTGPGTGIELFNGSGDAVIEDNELSHWLSIDRSSRSAIRRNYIGDHSGDVQLAGLELVSSSDVTFVDNVVDGGCYRGISISNGPVKERLYFSGNVVEHAETWGVQIGGVAGGVTRQLAFYDNSIDGTHAAGPSEFPDQGHAFRFYAELGTIEDVAIVHNRFMRNDGYAIQCGGPMVEGVTLRANQMMRNGGGAFAVNFNASGGFPGEDLSAGQNRSLRNGRLGDQLPTSMGYSGNQEPVVTINAPTVVAAGTPLDLTFEFEDDGTIGDVLWDTGVGAPVVGQAASVTYTEPGDYTIHLLVWDNGRRVGRATHTVRVGMGG